MACAHRGGMMSSHICDRSMYNPQGQRNRGKDALPVNEQSDAGRRAWGRSPKIIPMSNPCLPKWPLLPGCYQAYNLRSSHGTSFILLTVSIKQHLGEIREHILNFNDFQIFSYKSQNKLNRACRRCQEECGFNLR